MLYKNKLLNLTSALTLLTSLLTVTEVHSADVALSSDRSRLTITGMEFGAPPNVVVHDDFDEGPSGKTLVGWQTGSSHGSVPIYSRNYSVSGLQSGVSRFIGENYNSTAEYRNLGSLRQVYLSYYFKIEHLSGEISRNIKLARLSSGYSSSYNTPMSGITSFANAGNGIAYLNQGGGAEMLTTWTGAFADNNWHRAEHDILLSSYPGAKDGRITIKIDSKPIVNEINIDTEITGNSFEWLTLPYFVSHSPGGDYNIYYDNVHLATNQARVEICESKMISQCKSPVVAIINSWESKTLNLDIQSLNFSDPQYLHIFNSDGKPLNEVGLSVCTKCPKSPTMKIE